MCQNSADAKQFANPGVDRSASAATRTDYGTPVAELASKAMVPLPIQFLLFILVGWVSRQQQEAIEYLKAENLALREQLGGKRLRFTDAQRRRLARKAKPLGSRRLCEIAPIVTPDTLLRWYRELVAKKIPLARSILMGASWSR